MDIKINNIDIAFYEKGQFDRPCEGVTHVKTLPYMSIVQSLRGSYDVTLTDGKTYRTTEGGIFIAPSQVRQTLTHHNSVYTDSMRARYLFLDVLIDGLYRIDDIFNFPTLINKKHLQEMTYYLDRLFSERNSLCADLSEIYKIIDILLLTSSPKTPENYTVQKITNYVKKHYSDKIKAEDIAEAVNLSTSSLFRIFKKYLKISPANYINRVRIQHAAALLETKSYNISEIANHVGFDDIYYFSKLFKNHLGISPSKYRSDFLKTHRIPR